MKQLSSAQLLRIWERGRTGHSVNRALSILAEAEPDAPLDQLGALPIGQRDERLIAIRNAMFGPQFQALFSCPYCGERIEFGFSSDDLRGESSPRENFILSPLRIGEFVLELRFPNSTDLTAVSHCADIEAARHLLGRRCVNTAQKNGKTIVTEAIPDDLIPEIARHLDASDPFGDSTIDVACPTCHRHSEPLFDIADFFWTEIQAEAIRLFREIHSLASGYGWREADILAMTALRRRAYLEMLQG